MNNAEATRAIEATLAVRGHKVHVESVSHIRGTEALYFTGRTLRDEVRFSGLAKLGRSIHDHEIDFVLGDVDNDPFEGLV